MSSKRIRWNRVAILLVGVIGILTVCCIGVVALAPNIRRIVNAPFWTTEPQAVAQAAHKLLDYELPPNYQELKALQIQGATAIAVMARREQPLDVIAIQKVPDGALTDEELRVVYEERWSREIAEHT